MSRLGNVNGKALRVALCAVEMTGAAAEPIDDVGAIIDKRYKAVACAASGCAAPVAVAAEVDAGGPGIQCHRALFLGLLRLAPRRPLLPLRSLLLLVIRIPGSRFQRLVPAQS